MKPLPKSIIVCLAAFVAPLAIIYFVARRPALSSKPPTRIDTIEDDKGLREGENASLPELKNLSDETVVLGKAGSQRLLCVFFSASCSGCALDADFWRILDREAHNNGVAFYLVDVGDDAPAVQKFADNYQIAGLPILFDPAHHIGRDLRVGLVPQYLLLSAEGRVLHRWDGLRRNDPRSDSDKLADFFHTY